MLVEVLCDLRYVVASGRQMLRVPRFHAGPRVRDVEIRDVPVLDQAPELRHHSKSLELSQPLDGQNTGVVQLEILPLLLNALLSVDRLIGDGRSLAAAEVDEVPGPSVSPPPVPKHFAGYDDPSILAGDPEKIRCQAPTTLPKLDRDPDRSLAAARDPAPRNPPRRVTAAATFWVRASLRNVKTSNRVDFPDPFAPTTMASWGRSSNFTLRNTR